MSQPDTLSYAFLLSFPPYQRSPIRSVSPAAKIQLGSPLPPNIEEYLSFQQIYCLLS